MALVWLHNILIWTKGFGGVIITASPVLGTFVYIRYMHGGEASIRYSGLLLSLVGLSLVAVGVAKTRRKFGHPSLFIRPFRFFRSFPAFPRTITGSGNITMAAATSKGSGFVTPSRVGLTMTERLELLEKDTIELRSELYRARAEVDQRFIDQITLLEAEKSERKGKDEQLRGEIEATATGGLDQSLYGLAWLFFGSIYTTVPVELCEHLQSFYHWSPAGVCGP